MDKYSVCFVVGTPHASGYYRMTQAAGLMRHMKYPVETVVFNGINPMSLTATKRVGLNYYEIDLTAFGTVVFQLVWHESIVHVMNMLKSKGVKVCMEIDDDYFHIPADNPSFIAFHPKMRIELRDGQRWAVKQKEKVNFAIDNLRQACIDIDMIQVSTPELGELYGNLNDNIVVLENCVENEFYDKFPKVKNRIPVIGWFGTKTHEVDLEQVLGAFPYDLPFRFLLAGYPDAKAKVFKNAGYVRRIPPYKLSDLPTIVKKCDIGIIPLRQCRFNDGKSDLKGVEFGAGYVPSIASDVAPYRRWIRQGINGFLVKNNSGKDWVRYIRRLLVDEKLRTQMGVEAKNDARKRDIKNYIHKWIEVYFK